MRTIRLGVQSTLKGAPPRCPRLGIGFAGNLRRGLCLNGRGNPRIVREQPVSQAFTQRQKS